jgi:hypothetical protein
MEGKLEVTGGRGRRCKQLLDDIFKEKYDTGSEKRSSSFHSVENWLWNSLRTCRKADKELINIRNLEFTSFFQIFTSDL